MLLKILQNKTKDCIYIFIFICVSVFFGSTCCGPQLDVKLQVEYMSFSAHADAKGIMQLIRMAEPRNMLLVHGEAAKMEFLKGKIEQEFSKWYLVFEEPGPVPARLL